MKESEPGDLRCPGCGGPGEEVGRPTLEAQLPPEALGPLKGAAYYCADPACAVAYFGGWGAAVPHVKLRSTAYPKNPEGPICPCFGVKASDVVADARDGRKDRVKSLLERARGPEARCAERSPDGRCCAPLVSRLFRESFEAR
jgi:hypothetical protein